MRAGFKYQGGFGGYDTGTEPPPPETFYIVQEDNALLLLEDGASKLLQE